MVFLQQTQMIFLRLLQITARGSRFPCILHRFRFSIPLDPQGTFFWIVVSIPLSSKKEIVCFLKRVSSLVHHLHLVEADVPLSILCKDEQKLEHALGREFHISLGRSVPLSVHQINYVVSMLRQKLQFHKRYLIDFSKWQVFVNDDSTRSFLSLEITTSGLSEISKQIEAVNEVYKLHNLPEFYKVYYLPTYVELSPQGMLKLSTPAGRKSRSLISLIVYKTLCDSKNFLFIYVFSFELLHLA